jgi:hypothetical protein
VANLSLMCYDVSGVIEINVNNTGWVALSAAGCANCVVTDGSGNAAIAGDFTALELILSGLGPLDILTPCNTLSAPPAGYGLWGMGAGCVPVIYPSTLAAVVPVAYQDGFGNVYQNANTATALAATPAQCSGQYATGVTANGTANCSTSTYVLIPEIAAPTGVSGNGIWYIDSTSHTPKFIDPSFASGAAQYPLFKSNNYATWGPCSLGGVTSVTQYCSWTLPVGVTAVQMDMWTTTGFPAGCSTYPVVSLQDQTAGSAVAGFALTLSAASNESNLTGSAGLTAGHTMTFKVTTAGVGCTPANVTVTLTYQMS